MHYSRRTWCCPYFRSDRKREVRCEGGSRVVLEDGPEFKRFCDRFCGNAKGWEDCAIAQGLTRIWEKTDNYM